MEEEEGWKLAMDFTISRPLMPLKNNFCGVMESQARVDLREKGRRGIADDEYRQLLRRVIVDFLISISPQ